MMASVAFQTHRTTSSPSSLRSQIIRLLPQYFLLHFYIHSGRVAHSRLSPHLAHELGV